MELRRKFPHRPELDGVRGIAVLAVLAFHFSRPIALALPYSWILRVVNVGWAGVDLFFVLSGFLITRILLNTRGSSHFFRNFYARRALRIFPAYCLVVGSFFFIILPVAHAHGKIIDIHYREQFWYWLFLENWRVGLGYNDGAELPHLWSVAVEEQFYIIWSITVAWFGGARYFVRLASGLLIFFFLLRLTMWQIGTSELFIRQNTFSRIDGLIAGAILAASPRVCAGASRFAAWTLLVGCSMLIGFPSSWGPILFFTNALTFAGLVARASQGGFSLLRWRILRSFGKYSYAIYLFHFIVVEALLRLEGRFHGRGFGVAIVISGVGLSYGLAWVSWHVLEGPALRWKRLFPNQRAYQ